jgi:hypothetical protein
VDFVEKLASVENAAKQMAVQKSELMTNDIFEF